MRQYLPKALADFNSQGRLTRENTKNYSERLRSRLKKVRRSEIPLAEVKNSGSKVFLNHYSTKKVSQNTEQLLAISPESIVIKTTTGNSIIGTQSIHR